MPDAIEKAGQLRSILAQVRALAADYYRLTGRPLGVTGELAEYAVADIFGWELAPPREAGFDAIRRASNREERIQVKGRAIGPGARGGQRLGIIKQGANCDFVVLVVLDPASMEALEVWEAPYAVVAAELAKPGSNARARGLLAVSAFKNLARRIWSADAHPSGAGSAPAGAVKTCPECGKDFRGKGWEGIDAHWRSMHQDVMSYEEARQHLLNGSYKTSREGYKV